MTTTMTRLMTAPPVGTNAWSFSAASETPLIDGNDEDVGGKTSGEVLADYKSS
jgi:hypothetical protein